MKGAIAILASLAVLAAAATAFAAPSNPRLAAVQDFAFALGVDADDEAVASALASYDLVVVDGEQTRPTGVARLRAQGAIVLGYLSVGTIEPFRPWYKKLKRYRLPDRFEEFDEDYARVSARGFRRAIANRIAPRLLDKGFDGLFLDNTDMIEDHPRQRRGMRRLVRMLSALARGRGGLLFAQNGERSIDPLLPFYDGWNREDVTSTYSFKRRRYVLRPPSQVEAAKAALVRIGAAGLLVTATDYVAFGDTAAEQASVANTCAVGAIPFVSNIGLTRLPAQPLRCSP